LAATGKAGSQGQGQRGQIIFFKLAKSDVKTRVVFEGLLVWISPYLKSGPGKIFSFFENILKKITFLSINFLCKKK
jgi:hypothetical protein